MIDLVVRFAVSCLGPFWCVPAASINRTSSIRRQGPSASSRVGLFVRLRDDIPTDANGLTVILSTSTSQLQKRQPFPVCVA